IVRPDLGLVGLDDCIERRGLDVAFLGQDGLQRAHAQLHLGELRAVLVVMVVVVIVVFAGHLRASGQGFWLIYSMPSLSRMLPVADRIDRFNTAIGRTVAWAALFVVLLQF